MNRIIRGTIAKKRRKKIIKYTKGCFGSHSKLFTISNQQFMKSKSYSYSDRRKKKKELQTFVDNKNKFNIKKNWSKI